MSNPLGDRNLLVGIVALQKKFISRDALVAALAEWTRAREKGLAQILREQKALNENQHALLEEAVYEHLAKHGNDAQEGLAALDAATLKEELAAVADADLRAGLARLGTKTPIEPSIVAAAPVPVPKPAVKSVKPAVKKPAAAVRKSSGGIIWLVLAGVVVLVGGIAVLFAGIALVLGIFLVRPQAPDKPIAEAAQPADQQAPRPVERNPQPIIEPEPIEVIGKPKPPEPAADGFVPLFNGKDLTGWKKHPDMPGEWRVENGILIGLAGAKNQGRLTTEKIQPRDFHLRVEARVEKHGGAGNVFFRSPPGTLMAYELNFSGIPMALLHRGEFFPDARKFPGDPAVRFQPAAGEWFTLEAIADGTRLIAKVNGKEITDVVDASLSGAGHVGVSAGSAGPIAFRRIEIKDLRKGEPPVAVVDKDFVPLFNGKDLTGWKKHATFPGEWRVENGILIGAAGPRNRGRLETEQVQPKDFHLRVEARIAKANAIGNVFFRAPADSLAAYESAFGNSNAGLLMYQNPGVALRTFPRNLDFLFQPQPGEWFTLEWIVQGDRLIGKVNGQETTNVADASLPNAGQLGMNVYSQSAVEFRKIEIKELKGVAAPPPVIAADGFVPLFNGKDLTGWKKHRSQGGNWGVENGLLVGSGDGKLGLLFTDRVQPKNFHLRLEARVGDKARAAVMIRCPENSMSGYEAMLARLPDAVSGGNLRYQLPGESGNLPGGFARVVPPDQWITLEIVANEKRLIVKVNGEVTTDVEDARTLNAGHIRLMHAQEGKIAFRKIEIKELKGMAPPPPPVIAADGFVPLFNGKDLTGWKHAPFQQGKWRIEDGVLIGTGGKGNLGMLFTDRTRAKNFHLRVEAKVGDQGSADLRFRCPDNTTLGYYTTINSTLAVIPYTGTLRASIPGRSVDLVRADKPSVPADQWFLLEIIADGQRLIVKIDGKVAADVIDQNHPAAAGHIGLCSSNGTISFRKVEIKELDGMALAPPPAVGPPPPAGPINDAPPFKAEEGFVPLFNGKDLTGWKKYYAGDWRVQNGVLIASPAKPAMHYLRTDEPQAKDFHLRVEMRVVELGIASIRFRGPADQILGYGAMIHPANNAPGRINAAYLSMTAPGRGTTLPGARQRQVPAGQWFNLEILAQGNRLIVKVNGETTADVVDATHADNGHIMLGQMGKAVIEFRKIEIKELKTAGPVAPPVVAADGFTPLFNQKDLTGWKIGEQAPGSWRVDKGILISDGPRAGMLQSNRNDYKDYHLRVEGRFETGIGSSGIISRADSGRTGYESLIMGGKLTEGIYLRGKAGAGQKIPSAAMPEVKAGEWFTLEHIVQGNRIKVVINGKETADFVDEAKSFNQGQIAFRQASGWKLEFRKVEIKELNQLAAAPPPPPPPPPPAADFVPLFNGKDLTGWKSNREDLGGWNVVNGILTGSGRKLAELYTPRSDYGDFHLRMEARVNENGNNFVMVRYPHGVAELDKTMMGGYGVRINTRAADTYKTGSLYVFDGAGVRTLGARINPVEAGQWFTLEIIAKDNQISVKVNGAVAQTYTDTKNSLPGGRIVLGFADSTRQTVIEYRKIEIQEFKAVAAPPAPPTVRVGRFTPLLNGKDLTGWHVEGKDGWRVAPDGALVGAGPNTALVTDRKNFKNFIARVDIAAEADVQAMFGFRQHWSGKDKWLGLTSQLVGDGLQVRMGAAGSDSSAAEKSSRTINAKPGAVLKLEFHVQPETMRIYVNDIATGGLNFAPDRFPAGAVGLYLGKGSVRILKFEIAEELPAEQKFEPVGAFVPLFNGKDLDGWQAHASAKGNWRVENGIIVGDAENGGLLHTAKADYADFNLRMEARFSAQADTADGAILFRSKAGRTGCELVFAKNKLTGGLYLSGEDFGRPIAPKNDANIPSGQWFKLDLAARGKRLLVQIDGKETLDCIDDEEFFKTGQIALRQGAGTKLEVRKAELQEWKLVAAAAKPAEAPPAPLEKGFNALFNGKDLAGWQPHAKRPGNWRVDNGVLIGSAAAGGSLYTTRGDFQDFRLRAELRINDKGFGRIFTRAAYDPTKIPFKVNGYEVLINQRPLGDKTGTLTAVAPGASGSAKAKDSPALAAGAWMTVEIIAQGDLVTVKVDGATVAEFRDANRQFARTGHIALHQDAGATIEFRKVEVEDLTGKNIR